MNTETRFGSEAALLIKSNRGDQRDYTIKSAQGVFVGKSSNCGIQLDDQSLADIHCRLELDQGSLRLQKWLSAGTIKVNHEEIEFEVCLAVNDLIQLGEYEIRIVKQAQPSSLPPNRNDEKTPSQTRRADGKHLNHASRYDGNSSAAEKVVMSSQTAATNSLEKLQQYLDEITRQDESESSVQSIAQQGGEHQDVQAPKADKTIDASGKSSQVEIADEDLVGELRQEIAKLQNQLSETAQRNDRLQQRLLELSERKGERRGSLSDLHQQSSTLAASGSNNSDTTDLATRAHATTGQSKRDTSYSSLAHTTKRTKSLTTKRLSDTAIDGRQRSLTAPPNPVQSEDRIQSLRTQLREQYESNKSNNSLFGRLTQLWK